MRSRRGCGLGWSQGRPVWLTYVPASEAFHRLKIEFKDLQGSYVREFRRAGFLDVAAEFEAMTEEEFMEARRRTDADNQ
jgi:hypothetical protein